MCCCVTRSRLITQMAQTAVCNRHHSLDQQLCRWLLLSLDRLAGNQLQMTQELIANMLGVRREGVTEAAGKLQKLGVIKYVRGKITVLDRPHLERLSCECYCGGQAGNRSTAGASPAAPGTIAVAVTLPPCVPWRDPVRQPVVKDNQVAGARNGMGQPRDAGAVPKVAISRQIVTQAHRLTRRKRHAVAKVQRDAGTSGRALALVGADTSDPVRHIDHLSSLNTVTTAGRFADEQSAALDQCMLKAPTSPAPELVVQWHQKCAFPRATCCSRRCRPRTG